MYTYIYIYIYMKWHGDVDLRVCASAAALVEKPKLH